MTQKHKCHAFGSEGSAVTEVPLRNAAALEARLRSQSEKAVGKERKINTLEASEPMLCLLICFSKNVYIVNWNLGCVYMCGHLSPCAGPVSHSVTQVSGSSDWRGYSFDQHCGLVTHVDLTLGTLLVL